MSEASIHKMKNITRRCSAEQAWFCIDVSNLERQAWYPGEWFSYYETGQLPDKARKSDPPPVYQLVSQPLDGYRYGNQSKLPYLSRQTDFTVLYMDMNADDWGETMTLHFMSSKKEGFMVSRHCGAEQSRIAQ
jgi:hypothetical protein